MLTNGFSQTGMAALQPGATVECIEPVAMLGSGEIAFTAGLKYEVVEVGYQLLRLINDSGRRHSMDGLFFRAHFIISQPATSSK